MTTVTVEELELHLADVLARVEAGETVLLARNGEPVAQISPCESLDARLERAFPGMRQATKHMRDIEIHPVHLEADVDVMAILNEVRADRDLLS